MTAIRYPLTAARCPLPAISQPTGSRTHVSIASGFLTEILCIEYDKEREILYSF